MNKHDSYTSESNHSAVDSDLETAPTSSKKNDVDQTTNPSEQSIDQKNAKLKTASTSQAKEIGGPKGLEPTRYGDWEAKGRCYDF
ncbi:MAG: DUF1674 domain-containing protein [Arenicella sp.]|jgi:hypothetical protein|nr:DUF1674 domain-containing protein [Arenicella sp.]